MDKNQSKLILGTAQFGLSYGINNTSGQVSFDEANKIIAFAKKSNVIFVDTSYAYGSSEVVLGLILSGYPQGSFNIISKFPRTDKSVYNVFRESLGRVRQGKLYGYMVHHFDFYRENPTIWNEFLELKERDLVQKIGFSIYDIKELEYLLDNNVEFDLLQFPYNIFDRRFAPYLSVLKKLGVEIHTRSVFLQGLFFKEISTLPAKLLPLRLYLSELHNYCINYSINVGELALRFVANNPFIDKVLVGVENVKQLNENVNNCDYSLSDKDMSFVSSIDIMETDLLNPVNWH